MSNMVLTKNFYNFIRTVLLSNPTANGIICADANTARRGWSGSGYAGESVAALSHFTNTSGSNITGGLLGSSSGSNGYYYGQQASLNKFDTDNFLGVTDVYKGITYFRVGTGTTAADESDFKLENELSSDYVQIRLSSVHLSENGCGVLRFFVSVKNVNANAVTISEIGMFKYLALSNYANSTRIDCPTLFGRHVLPMPVTIPSQESRIFTVEIKI